MLPSEDPAPSKIYVEDTSNATALIQALKQDTTLPVVPIAAKGNKESRVEGVTGVIEPKKIFLPNEALWLLEFERELLAFPAGKNDDMVDAFTLALSRAVTLNTSRLPWGVIHNQPARFGRPPTHSKY
jgi:predicted phage terminase large subunit-like protein